MSDAPIHVLIPTPLRRYTNGAARVEGHGATVAELLNTLDVEYPGLADQVRESDGRLRRFVNVFINGENARDRDGVNSALHPGDEVGIIPAMAGGSVR